MIHRSDLSAAITVLSGSNSIAIGIEICRRRVDRMEMSRDGSDSDIGSTDQDIARGLFANDSPCPRRLVIRPF